MVRGAKKTDSLYESDIWQRNPKKGEIIEFLGQLHESLSKLDQDIHTAPRGLHETAVRLVTPKYLENSDREVRILATCCVTDVLRIYAPEAPYKDEDMIRAFEAITKQIRSLQTTDHKTPDGRRMLYILESIATVKSCLVPVLLDQKGVRSAAETVEELFIALTSIVDANSSEDVFTSVCEVLQSCIEEYNNISPDLLEILLVPLLPAQKAENPMLHRVIATVLRTVSQIIQSTLNSMMASILVGPGNQFHGKLGELADDVYPLIYELHMVSPELMSGILPNLTVQLRSEDEANRGKVVQLLSKLYTSDATSYATDFSRDFREFIGRMHDASTTIRMEVIEHAVTLMCKGVEVKFISDALVLRLKDHVEEVRLHAVTKLFKQVQEHFQSFEKPLLTELFDRVKDKVFEIRKAAMVGMAKLYWRHVSSTLPAFSDIEFRGFYTLKENVPIKTLSKLDSIPGRLVKCWGMLDMETRHLTMQLLQEYIVPKSFPSLSVSTTSSESASMSGVDDRSSERAINDVRLTAAVLLFALLDEDDRPFLHSILSFKAKINSCIANLIETKKGGRDSVGSQNSGHQQGGQSNIAQLKQVLGKLSVMIPTPDKRAGFFDRLLTTRDKSIWKLLERCTETGLTVEQNLKYKDDLLKKLDSKSPLAEYFNSVYDFGSYMLFTSNMVDSALSVVLETGLAAGADLPRFFSLLSKNYPKLFAGAAEVMGKWLTICTIHDDDKGKKRESKMDHFQQCVAAISSSAPQYENVEQVEKLGRTLLDAMKSCTNQEVNEKLGQCLNNVVISQEQLTSRFLRDVVKYVKDFASTKSHSEQFLGFVGALSAMINIPYEIIGSNQSARVLALQSLYAIFSNSTRQLVTDHAQNILYEAKSGNASAVSATMTLLTKIVIFEDAIFEMRLEDGFEFLSDLNRTVNFEDHVQHIFTCLESTGETFADVRAENGDQAVEFYQCAASSGLAMIATGGFSNLSTDHWHLLGWTLLQDNLDRRQALVEEMCQIIRYQQVHLRFLAYPCLVANDNQLSKQAKAALSLAISRLRRTHEDIAARLLSEQDETEKATLHEMAAATMPENIMPYLLHILSYHPEFPTSVNVNTDEDKARMRLVVTCIRFLIQSLQSTLKTSTSNLPFLLKQLNTINHKFVDRLDPNNVGLHFVARLTIKLLQDQVKTVENLHSYPGEVFLPRELFEGIEAGKAQEQLGRIAAGGRNDMPNILDVADNAIDRVMQIAAGKGRNKQGTTMSSPAVQPRRAKLPDSGEKKHSRVSRALSFEDGYDDEEDRPKKKSKVAKPLPEEVPSRSLPSRSVKTATKSYAETEVTETEVNAWNRSAGESRRSSAERASRSISPVKRPRLSEERSFLKSRSAETELDSQQDDEIDLFASQQSKKARRSTSSNPESEVAQKVNPARLSSNSKVDKKQQSDSTDAEYSQNSSSPEMRSAKTKATQNKKQANNVLSERSTNIPVVSTNQRPSLKGKSSDALSLHSGSSEEDVRPSPTSQKATTKNSRASRSEAAKAVSKTTASPSEEPVKVTGKRARQMRA